MVFTILIVDDEKEMCLSKIGTIETADEIVFGRAGDLQRLGA
ncbi:MAG TPA: hypothetical protein VMU36_05950 [Spirochaetia bacterium]|nr:hypothetical protein [Spirochaetia bacterium]